ncbi:MAG: hypothetical protein WD294_15645 [Phycisphaeraceae bacterium]
MRRWITLTLGCFVAAALASSPAHADTVAWDVDVDGNWEAPANWSTGSLPAPGDDVLIDNLDHELLITLTADQSVRSLSSTESLHLAQGSLTLSFGGDIHGSLTIDQNRSLSINGGTFTAHGSATVDGANLFATGGGTLTLTNLASYAGSGSATHTSIQANGAGTAINLASVTTLAGNTFPSARLNINAINGGAIDLSALTEVTGGKVSFLADGAGSELDLSQLTSITHSGNIASVLEATDNGVIIAPNLTHLYRVNLNLDATGGVLPTSQLTHFQEGVATVHGTTPDFSSIVNVNGSGFIARDAAVINLENITSYAGSTRAVHTDLKADGPGSLLNLSNVTTMVGNTFASTRLNINAVNGGEVDLSALTEVTGGKVSFTADGAGSQIDLSQLTSIDHGGNLNSILEATDNGVIIAPNLTHLYRTNLNLDNTGGVLPTSQITHLQEGIVTIRGITPDFSGIIDVNGSGLVARDAAVINLENVTSYAGSTRAAHTDLLADGAGSLLDLSNVTTMAGNTFASTRLGVTATNGGQIDLSSVASATHGRIRFEASGENSQIDLASLTSFTSTGNIISHITADQSGRVLLNPAQTLQLTDVHVIVTETGIISGDSIELLSTGTTTNRTSRLLGAGTLDASLINTSGQLQPDGSLMLAGAFEQATDAALHLDLWGTETHEYDRITIEGDASLAGLLALNLDAALTLAPDLVFTVLDISGTRTGTFDGFAEGDVVATHGGQNLFITYAAGDGNNVALYTTITAIPQPATLWLLAAAYPMLLKRRRRG